MAAMRSYMRDINLGGEGDATIPHSVGMDPQTMEEMYRLLAIAKYDERYVIPAGHAEQAHDLEGIGTDCPLNFDGGPGMEDVPGLQGNGLKLAGDADRSRLKGRLNLFNWDGRGRPDGLFPKPAGA
jgi:nitrate reductase beta subunit